MQDSDEDLDSEIREAQREFHELRRAEIGRPADRSPTSIFNIQREQDLLAQFRGRLKKEPARPESRRGLNWIHSISGTKSALDWIQR
jgi:hypothetical protein